MIGMPRILAGVACLLLPVGLSVAWVSGAKARLAEAEADPSATPEVRAPAAASPCMSGMVVNMNVAATHSAYVADSATAAPVNGLTDTQPTANATHP